jgi:hypothetical protein
VPETKPASESARSDAMNKSEINREFVKSSPPSVP